MNLLTLKTNYPNRIYYKCFNLSANIEKNLNNKIAAKNLFEKAQKYLDNSTDIIDAAISLNDYGNLVNYFFFDKYFSIV